MPSLWFCFGKTPRKEGPTKREILLGVHSLPDVSWNPQYRMRQSFVVLQRFPRRVADPLDFGLSNGLSLLSYIPLSLRLQQTKVLPNAILNLPREFARLFRREEFLAARNAPVHPRIFDCYQNVVVAGLKSLANLLHAVRITNCVGNFHLFPCGFFTALFTSIAPHRPSPLPPAIPYPASPAADSPSAPNQCTSHRNSSTPTPLPFARVPACSAAPE